jgi:hypothetical protein
LEEKEKKKSVKTFFCLEKRGRGDEAINHRYINVSVMYHFHIFKI